MLPNLILIILLTNINLYASAYFYNENSPQNNLNILYFKTLFTTKVFCRQRSLEFSITLEPTDIIEKEINSNINQLENICKQTIQNHLCQYALDEIKISASNLRNKLNLINSFDQTAPIRDKRDMNEVIQKITTLADYGYSDLKQSFEQIKSIATLYEKIKRETSAHTDHINFISIFQLINHKIHKHSQNYHSILNILNKNLDSITSLIPMEMIKSELYAMEPILTKEYCEFPIELNNHQIFNLLKLSTLEAEINDFQLNLIIKIPSFYKSEFDLISAIPIPFNYDNISYELEPLTPFLLVSYNKIKNDYHIIPLSLDEKRNCSSLYNKMVCFPHNAFQVFSDTKNKLPEYLFVPSLELCNTKDIKTLKELQAIPSECNIKRIPHINKIIPLNYMTYYLYLIKPSQVTFDCFSMRKTYQVPKSILIKELKPDCSIEFDNGYYTTRQTTNYNRISFQSTIFTTHILTNNDLIKKDPSKNYSINIPRNLQPDFTDLHEKIKNTHTTANNKKIFEFSINTKIYLIFLILCLIIAILWSTTIYFIFYFKNKTQLEINKLYKNSPFSLVNYPNLHCSFKFDDKPPLPPKTRSLPFTPLETYDTPKFPPRTLQNQTTEKIIVHYATVNKNHTLSEPLSTV